LLIDVLLNFLGKPSEEYIKQGTAAADDDDKKPRAKAAGKKKKRSSSTSKKKKKRRMSKPESSEEEESEEETEEEEEESDFEEVKPSKKKAKKSAAVEVDDSMLLHVTKGKIPEDKTLKKWAHAFCMCHDMDKATLKTAMALASEKFGVDLSEKKDIIKECLKSEA